MNKDIIIGIVLSFLIHVLFLASGYFRTDPPQVQIEQVKHQPPDPLPMPPLEVEPVETTDQPGPKSDEPKKPTPLPPVQPELPPSPVEDREITQPLKPVVPGEFDPTITKIPPGISDGFARGVTIFDPDQLQRQPQATFQERPNYPYEAKRRGEQGTVNVGFIVDMNGRVRDAYIIDSSAPEFEEAALRAIRNWRFQPGIKTGRPVNTRMRQLFSFTLNNG